MLWCYRTKHQSLKPVHFVLYDPEITLNELFKYIEYQFIEIDGIHNEWYSELKHCLEQSC